MLTKYLHTYLWMTTLLLSITTSVFASDINLIPRAWLGVADYEYKQDARPGTMPDGSEFPEVKFNATLLMTGIGLTTTYNKWYFDMAYQDSSEEDDSFTGANFSEDFKGDRRDYSATLGYKLFDNQASVYVGYKNGKTSGSGDLGTQLTFREDGLFVGGSYAWLIANKGLLAVNLAYAQLDGHLKEIPGPSYPPGLGMDADSETTGVSYGISWNGIISKHMGYAISLDANDYTFNNLKDNSTNKPLPDKIEETFHTFKVSLSYRF